MLTLLQYDFGYSWPWTKGHALVFIIFAALAALAWRSRWRSAAMIAGLFSLWALIGAIVMLQMSLPMTLPTESFLRSGEGHVLDMGAGSGRSTLMVLQGRPRARVTALDRYSGYYGIVDNTPERLRANARVAGAEDRVDVTVADMREMPFPTGTFDGVVSAFAIDHLGSEGVTRALSEAARVLRPDGEFLLVIVNLDVWTRIAVPWMAIHGHGYFGHPQDPYRWTTALHAAGFDLVEHGTGMAAQYFLCRKKPGGAPVQASRF